MEEQFFTWSGRLLLMLRCGGAGSCRCWGLLIVDNECGLGGGPVRHGRDHRHFRGAFPFRHLQGDLLRRCSSARAEGRFAFECAGAGFGAFARVTGFRADGAGLSSPMAAGPLLSAGLGAVPYPEFLPFHLSMEPDCWPRLGGCARTTALGARLLGCVRSDGSARSAMASTCITLFALTIHGKVFEPSAGGIYPVLM